jgi:hypothetical protein
MSMLLRGKRPLVLLLTMMTLAWVLGIMLVRSWTKGIVFSVSMGWLVLSTVWAAVCDPGYVEQDWKINICPEGYSPELPECTVCNEPKPLRAHHCR